MHRLMLTVRDVPAIDAGQPGGRGEGPGQPAAVADEPAAARRRGGPRRAAGRQRPAEPEDGRPGRRACRRRPERPAGRGPWRSAADPTEHVRRSVYLFARRNLRHPFLEAFDLPDSNLSCPQRERSTTAPQALALLNADEACRRGEGAGRATDEARRHRRTERIELAYRLTLGRSPTAAERERAAAFLRESPLSELCRALFNLNEFVYLD